MADLLQRATPTAVERGPEKESLPGHVVRDGERLDHSVWVSDAGPVLDRGSEGEERPPVGLRAVVHARVEAFALGQDDRVSERHVARHDGHVDAMLAAVSADGGDRRGQAEADGLDARLDERVLVGDRGQVDRRLVGRVARVRLEREECVGLRLGVGKARAD